MYFRSQIYKNATFAMRYLPYLLFAVALMLVSYSNWRQRGLAPNALAAQFTFSSAAFGQVLSRWRQEQIDVYRKMLGVDLLTILLYACGGLLLARERSPESPAAAACLAGAILVAAGADLTENLLHWLFTAAERPPSGNGLHWLAGVASCLKFICGIVFSLLAIFRQHA